MSIDFEQIQRRIDLAVSGHKADEIDKMIALMPTEAIQKVTTALSGLPFVQTVEHPDMYGVQQIDDQDYLLVMFQPQTSHEPVLIKVADDWAKLKEFRRERKNNPDTSRRIFMMVQPDFSLTRIKRIFSSELRRLDGFLVSR